MFRINKQLLVCLKSGCSKASLVKFAAFSLSSAGILYGATASNMANASAVVPKTIFNFEVEDIDGNTVQLWKYKGFVTLIVNVASK